VKSGYSLSFLYSHIVSACLTCNAVSVSSSQEGTDDSSACVIISSKRSHKLSHLMASLTESMFQQNPMSIWSMFLLLEGALYMLARKFLMTG